MKRLSLILATQYITFQCLKVRNLRGVWTPAENAATESRARRRSHFGAWHLRSRIRGFVTLRPLSISRMNYMKLLTHS